MKSLPRFLIALLLTTLAFAGCQTPPPSPDVTRGAGGSGASPDWVDAREVYGPGAEGLELRGAGADGWSIDEQMRGVLPSVYFDFDRSSIRPAERGKVREAYDYLQEHRDRRILLEGHCDWRGTTEYNLALGDRRANSVRDYLITLGLDANRIETSSKGDLEANVGGSDREMQEDRRVDMIILRR